MGKRNQRHKQKRQDLVQPVEGLSLGVVKEFYSKKHTKKRAAELIARYFALVERDGPACDLCGSGTPLEFDHIIPKSRDGTNEIDNFCLAHEYCNKQKGEREHQEAKRELTTTRLKREAKGMIWPPEKWEQYVYQSDF